MYIFGGQVDDYYLGDIVAMDMKTSKLPSPPFFYPPLFFYFPRRPRPFHSTPSDQTHAAMTLFYVFASLHYVV